MKTWQLQEAKAKLSELVKTTLDLGPQGISVRGTLEVILISKKDYDKLINKKKPESFNEFMQKSPLRGLDLDLTRDQDPVRDIEL